MSVRAVLEAPLLRYEPATKARSASVLGECTVHRRARAHASAKIPASICRVPACGAGTRLPQGPAQTLPILSRQIQHATSSTWQLAVWLQPVHHPRSLG